MVQRLIDNAPLLVILVLIAAVVTEGEIVRRVVEKWRRKR